MEFRVQKKSFWYWVLSFYSPFLAMALLFICLKLGLSAVLLMPALLISLFLFWVGFDAFCSTLILDDNGIQIISAFGINQLEWPEIKQVLLIKLGNSLYIQLKDETKEEIYFNLSSFSLRDQEIIEKTLREKTTLVVELPENFGLPSIQDDFINRF